MTITADCELWLDGVRVPDRGYQLEQGAPTALSALVLQWGRGDSVSQPDTATCRFALYDSVGVGDSLALVHVGMPVEVYASGITGGADEGQPYYPDPGFDSLPLGALDIARYQQTGTFVPTVVDIAGTHAVQLAGVTDAEIWITPLPFDDINPAAWDDLPQMTPGQTWAISVTARLPEGSTGRLVAHGYVTPTPAGLQPADALVVDAATLSGSDHSVTVTGTVTAAGDVPVWIALGVAVALPGGPTWAQATGTWVEHPETWESYATADLYRLQATTQGDTVRRVLVFAGAVTDAVATPAEDSAAIQLDVTAADITADMASDVIGGEPWSMEPIATRIERITSASRLQVPVIVDATAGALAVSWRDVDAQNTVDLLRDLAQTAGAVLWPSAHATQGGYLWIEDPALRAALRSLAMRNGVIIVVGGTGRDIDIISACDVLRDPVQLEQTVSDITTTVAVSWQEQTLDDDGNQAPTERSYVTTDEVALEIYGLRRLQVATELTTEADADALAARTLQKSRAVNWRASGYTLDTAVMLDSLPSITNAQRMAALMDLLDGTTRIGQAIALTDLPPWLPGTVGRAYVEGSNYSYRDGWWALELTISPAESSGVDGATWAQLPPDWHWHQWEPGLTWIDILGATYEGTTQP